MLETMAGCDVAVSSVDRAPAPLPAGQPDWSRARTPFLIGALLVTAAALKTHRLWTEPNVSPERVLESPWFQGLLIEVEFVLGTALLLQIKPRLCRLLAIGLFTAFLATILPEAIEGRRSCACFGKVELSPWLAAGVDVTVLLLLLRWSGSGVRLSQNRSLASAFFAQTGACLVVVPAGWYWNYNDQSNPALRTSPPVLEAGDLRQGERRTLRLLVQNPHHREVQIEHVDPSCPCLRALALPWRFLVGEDKTVFFELDMAQERLFVGSLRIEYTGKTPDGKEALHGYVLAQVK